MRTWRGIQRFHKSLQENRDLIQGQITRLQQKMACKTAGPDKTKRRNNALTKLQDRLETLSNNK